MAHWKRQQAIGNRTCYCDARLSCPLDGEAMVPGDGSEDPVIVFVGEAPGIDERASGRPFVGKSGQELDMYLWRYTRVSRDNCYVTNLVKCRPAGKVPGKDKPPKPAVIAVCTTRWLVAELAELRPRIVAAVGATAARWLIGPAFVSLARNHGVAFNTDFGIVLPLYHPAAGLHSPRTMRHVIADFTALGELVRKPEVRTMAPAGDYGLLEVIDAE